MERPGIFVKSVVAGSAASRDGRLGPGDQLLEVEGVSLCGRSQVRLLHFIEHENHDIAIAMSPSHADPVLPWLGVFKYLNQRTF